MGVKDVAVVQALTHLDDLAHQLGPHLGGVEGWFDSEQDFGDVTPDEGSVVVCYLCYHLDVVFMVGVVFALSDTDLQKAVLELVR